VTVGDGLRRGVQNFLLFCIDRKKRKYMLRHATTSPPPVGTIGALRENITQRRVILVLVGMVNTDMPWLLLEHEGLDY
jgi:hypothetical protein